MTIVSHRIDDQVCFVTLDGPASMNSLTPAALDGLELVLNAADGDQSIRAMVITGAGTRAFCVGMDIDFLEDCFADPLAHFLPFLRRYHALLDRIEQAGYPVIARVNGLARAGGFELILACDFVVACDEARVGDIHLEFGVSPGGGSTQRAPRKLGDQRAKLLLLTPTWLDGRTMVEWGLALASVPQPRLDEEVERLLDLLRRRSRPAMATTKRLINAAASMTLDDGLRFERDLFSQLLESDPGVSEGFNSFRGNRGPRGREVATDGTP